MPRYTDQSWKIVDAAASTIVGAINECMGTVNIQALHPEFSEEECELVYRRMIRYAKRMVEIAGYDASQMAWNPMSVLDEEDGGAEAAVVEEDLGEDPTE